MMDIVLWDKPVMFHIVSKWKDDKDYYILCHESQGTFEIEESDLFVDIIYMNEFKICGECKRAYNKQFKNL